MATIENHVNQNYLYDGWNLIAELNANSSNAKVRTYIWGLDLSGSMQGAGGVGGLLMVIDHTGTTKRHYAAYDGNGNVMGLADSTTGDWSARYEYGPFGEPIRANGDLAYANPMRWSTKYTDGESGLVYYGYRSYNPSIGRWLSRDPKFEQGGLQLYIFVGNEPIGMYDYLGLHYDNPNWPPPIVPSKPYYPPNSPIYDCTCTCESVSVTYKPGGGGQPYLDYYYLRNAEQRYGSQVKVRWKVRGNPRKCEYFQDERNLTFDAVSPVGANSIKGKFEVVSQVYTDPMGIDVPFFSPPHYGTWYYWLNWDVTFICRSTDGSKVTRNDSAYLTGSFIYPNR